MDETQIEIDQFERRLELKTVQVLSRAAPLTLPFHQSRINWKNDSLTHRV